MAAEDSNFDEYWWDYFFPPPPSPPPAPAVNDVLWDQFLTERPAGSNSPSESSNSDEWWDCSPFDLDPPSPSSSPPLPPPPPPPPPPPMGWEYFFPPFPTRIHDVFLSFRGEDTRASFTSHLYAALQNAGVNVFRDDDSLPRGDQITNSLIAAIEQSEISVIVFSPNYADSRWCMEELVKIMDCHRTIGQVVLPVFYGVDPSEVRRQTGEFGKKFHNLVNKLPMDPGGRWKRWREALCEAGGIAGFVVLNSRNESEAIEKVVENVTQLLDKTDLFIADNPVGVESRVQDIIQLLDNQPSNDVLLLGVWGMGGIGKTTIAKAIYNAIGRNFESRSFLANVREVWEQDAGQVHLQEQLLFDIFKKTTKIHSTESGKNILKDRLCSKRVLLVLDDVNKLDQLNALCGSREWFGSGSRIIITTRDQHILRGNRVDQVYLMEEMDESESIELFSWHAFKNASPSEDFAEISINLVEYSGGLPLALEVLGSYLFDRGVTEWKSVLEKLKRIPNDLVQKKLKISYEGLNDTEKEIFLDIACFFIGMERNDVIHILNGCELYAEIGISVLVERSLVTVDDKNKLGMHDLLRDMGREIIREKSPKEPGDRSRLWFDEDVLGVLSEQTGTNAIEGLALKLPSNNTKCFSTKSFEKMKRLRLLQFSGVQLQGDFKYLSRNLRWLCWHGFPLSFIPKHLYQGSLVSIELVNSDVKLVWKEAQMMEKLKILNLSHSQHLTHTPDFSNLPNLEKLVLRDCPSLSEVSPSIGHLNKVVLINLKDCIRLRNLPRSIYKLKSLKTLILSGCLMIDKLEEDVEQMESLTTLIADNTAITRVPYSLVRSKSIGYISLCGHEGFSRDVFPSIIWSWMSPANNLPSLVQTSAGMSSLVSLDVSNSSSHGLSSIPMDLPKLPSLWMECGSELERSRDAEIVLDALYATNSSKELELTGTTSELSNVDTSVLTECNSQVHDSGSKRVLKSLLIQMGMNCQTTSILKESILQNMTVRGSGISLLPGDNYPDWLTFNCEGSSVIFEVPHVNGRSLKTMMFVVHSSTAYDITSDGLKNVLVINCTKNTIQLYRWNTLVSFEDEEWQRVVSNIEPGNKVEVVVVFENGFTVKKTAIYLIYDEPFEKEAVHHHENDTNVGVSGDDENRFDKLFSLLPPIVRAVLTSKPFWLIGLAVILIWSRCFFNQRRRRKPILRLVDAYWQGIYSKYFKFIKVVGRVYKTSRE
ncbi:disease resistance protein RUN1-like isoform X2 [Lotus japonicus]|uniref:disease resistance protein RUN1-like isoform X2 n=1 Tax=Lotus japonicus TaxID=34305 RepID=UPI0025890B71|nr:disease resistance protein RUN1-like isoform X2 [Lotus japonicus]